MPRVTTRPKKYNCPYCNKSYASVNSVYNHCKTVHDKKYSKNEESIINDPLIEKSERVKDLKEKFVAGELTLEEFQEQSKEIDQRFANLKEQCYVKLDLGKVFARDHEHIGKFIADMSDFEFDSLSSKVQSNNHIDVFIRLLTDQVQFTESHTGMTMRYLNYGKSSVRDIDVDEVIVLYRRLVNGMMKHILPKILSHIDDDDPDIDEILGPSNYYQKMLNGLGEAFMIGNRTALYNSLEVAMKKLDAEICFLSDV